MTILQLLTMMSPIRMSHSASEVGQNSEIVIHQNRIDIAFAQFEESVKKKDASHTQMIEAIEVNGAAMCKMQEESRKYIKKSKSGEHNAVEGEQPHG